ncbi:MAG: AAA family ATPase [Kiritimatiellae bacterium]|nr:AAA family ATPase [Kiritimatiellia bacterium]
MANAVDKKEEQQVCAGGAARTGRLLPPPVGTSDWATFSRDSYCVDKTLILKDLIDSKSRVVLFTRPRRFGKTTALEMIRAFYEDESSLFQDKKIWAAGEVYRKEQGKHPVIFLSFKDVKWNTFGESIKFLNALLAPCVGKFVKAVEALELEAERDRLLRVMREQGDETDLSLSLGLLSKAVHVFTKRLPVILIDEYDQPITSASTHGYYDEMCAFMRVFLSGALKDNKHCHIGIMTGVLRVAKEGILSGLNNPKVWTVFESDYSQYFGFTEDEVAEMARYYGAEDKLPEIKAWYDGYDFGGTEIYNPWSVLRYFDCHCRPDAYWLDTSSNDLISAIVRDLPHDMVRTLEALLRDETPRVQMAKELGPYKDVMANKSSLYALLVSAGYLKVASPIEEGMCKVALPNHELSLVFVNDIKAKINAALSVGTGDIVGALLDRDADALRAAIAAFLLESVSYFDAAAEGFFHGLTLGFLAILRKRFRVLSNVESGEGRFDIALKPLVEPFPAFIIEVKAADSATDDLKALARDARTQIDGKKYDTSFRAEGITDIEKIGLAYFKDRVEICKKVNDGK